MNTTQQHLTTRGQILALREEGLTVREEVDQEICRNRLRVYATALIPGYDTGDPKTILCLFSERRSRPRLNTRDEDTAIIAAIQNNPFSNPVVIREALHLDVCAQTFRSRLHEAGIQHRVPAIKERLTDQHRTGRLQFAQQYVGEDPEFWSRVVFTDEKTFASSNHGKIHLWRPNCTRYDKAHIYEVARSGHVTLNVRGYISLHGALTMTLIALFWATSNFSHCPSDSVLRAGVA
ncbi:putative Transposable element Tc1 transposase-like 19 [Homarus americanus]|uniref:Putative Transposable element Tc1 transposase-like 19 n=1 Tax=Homarus americanus TaxID=6706 RepID=A0A8J5N2M4_HOMAM|nr:putative Transposable element Tc1 transposase-like 19 [Homarus americanus]